MFGTLESERLKVTALNLFHPNASPLFEKLLFHIMAQSLMRRDGNSALSSQERFPDFRIGNQFLSRSLHAVSTHDDHIAAMGEL